MTDFGSANSFSVCF